MTPDELRTRTKRFALGVMDSDSRVGANYRAACRSRSRAEFIARIAVVEEEADESAYWLDLLACAGLVAPERVTSLIDEAGQLTAIAAASGKTARGRSR